MPQTRRTSLLDGVSPPIPEPIIPEVTWKDRLLDKTRPFTDMRTRHNFELGIRTPSIVRDSSNTPSFGAPEVPKQPSTTEPRASVTGRRPSPGQKSTTPGRFKFADLVRKPFKSELDFFKTHPDVSGVAAEDNRIVLNPNSKLSEIEKSAVIINEAARIEMRRTGVVPSFEITPKQREQFSKYGPDWAIRETIAARIISGDPTVPEPTPEQAKFADEVYEKMMEKHQ